MEIHKPKPVHSWRDFLKEVGIIVLGVSIALAGEQMVEKWREHRQYLEARDAMRAELANNARNLNIRRIVSPCTKKRIAEITSLLDKAERHESFNPSSWIGEASTSRIRYAAEGDAGRSSLFSTDEQRQFSNAYSYLHSIDLEQDRERQAWARLQSLEGRSNLPPEMIANLREALAQARFEDTRIMFLMGFVKRYTNELSLTVPTVNPADGPQAWPNCLPMNTPREEVIRLTAYRANP